MIFKPKQQPVLKISDDRQLVICRSGLVAGTFPVPDRAVPRQLATRQTIPAAPGSNTCEQHEKNGQSHSPVEWRGHAPPQQHGKKPCKPETKKQTTQKRRAPKRVNNRRGVVAVQETECVDAGRNNDICSRQTRLKTSVPLVPPKPKLFFTANSMDASRAVLAQMSRSHSGS